MLIETHFFSSPLAAEDSLDISYTESIRESERMRQNERNRIQIFFKNYKTLKS